MKPSQIEAIDIKRKPIIAINKKLNQARNMEIPQFKLDNIETAKKNTNLLDLVNDLSKRGITRP